tara:strand:- start:281 stop:1393 length:1113 start_codon:yes stop_codon:yes gene_type:complete
MLSLGSNISATQAVESKYSASFDGTDDFIDFGNVNNLGTGDFSFSFWVKASDTASNFLISKREDNDNRWYIRTEGNSRAQFFAKKSGSDIMNATSSSSGELSANVWNHVVIACDRSDGSTGLKFYINSSLENSRPASTTDIDNTGDFYIGKFSTNFAKDGTILEEIGIFNVALDADAVTAIYNSGSPINLTFDKGNYDNSSDLQAYYRMGDGFFDDKANGVVHDQDNPGFGSDLVLAGDFSDASEWSVGTGWAIAGGKATCTSGNSNLQQNGTEGGGSTWIVAGKTYKIIYTISDYTSGNLVIDIGGSSAYTDSSPTVGANKIYLTTVNTNHLRFYGGAFRGSISNVTVHQLNGNPGLTSGGVTFSSDTP